jgi:DNA-binding beta-propeller fold protein YncE
MKIRGRHVVIRCLLALALGVPVGAALLHADPKPTSEARPDLSLPVWPAAPARTSIQFVTTLLAAQGASAQPPSLWRRLARTLFARSSPSVVRPLGLAVKDDVLYVTDPAGHALVISDLKHGSLQRITRTGRDSLVSPVGVAVSGDRVLVSDSSLKRVTLHDRKGRFLGVFASSGLERPTGLAVDQATSRVYVVDTAAHQIRVYDRDGRFETTIGRRGTGDGEFNFPTHLWLDASGTLFVVDSLNYRVQHLRADGSFIAAFGHHGDGSGDFASPKGIAADTRGHLYVVDALFDSVQIFDREGRLLLTFGEQGTGPGRLWLPAGICIDEHDRIYVADSYNRRIQVFQFLGTSDAGHE